MDSNQLFKCINKYLKKFEMNQLIDFEIDYNHIEELNKKDLINLIQVVYAEMGDFASQSDFFGYYCKTLDDNLRLKQVIDIANGLYFENNSHQISSSDIYQKGSARVDTQFSFDN